jgi:preprotein translocase subunit SecY
VATNPNGLVKSGKFGDLKRRLTFLVLALVVYRIGAHIPVPGIDPDQLAQLFKSQQGGILGMFNMFSGGALSRFSIFALGAKVILSGAITRAVNLKGVGATKGAKAAIEAAGGSVA